MRWPLCCPLGQLSTVRFSGHRREGGVITAVQKTVRQWLQMDSDCPARLWTSCVNLEKLLHLTEPQAPPVQLGYNSVIFQGP